MKNICNFNEIPLSCDKEVTIGLDCDDLLLECADLAIKCVNRDYGLNLDPDNLKHWGYREGDYAKMYDYFSSKDFVLSQKPIEGAQAFVERLSKIQGVKVYFITAVPISMMGIRGECLQRYFPWIPTRNFILSSSKEVAHFDIFVDDACHNIFANNSDYKIVRRRSWNENISGMLSYSSFDELWVIVESILKRKRVVIDNKIHIPSVFAIVGPTGAGKNEIADLLVEAGMERPRSYTTRKDMDEKKRYIYIEEEEFTKLQNEGKFMETTVYGTHRFAIPDGEIASILRRGVNVVTVVDMCGVAALKSKYPTVAIYRDRKYEDLLRNILTRDYTVGEQINRIMALQSEQKNLRICDYLLPAEDSAEQAAQRVVNLIK